MEIKKVIENYLRSVKVKNSFPTYTCYSSHLKSIYDFCISNNFVVVNDLKKEFYLKFIENSINKNICNKTINKRLRLFIKALKYNKIYNAFEYESLKEKFKRFELVKHDDLKKIINFIYNMNDDRLTISNKVLVLLLIDTGIRINELLKIKINNIDLNKNKILLTDTKTNRDRIVYFNLYTREVIKKVISYAFPTDFLLYNFRKNKNYTYDCVRYFFGFLEKKLKISHIHPHMFRHTFINNLIENGAPVFFVQQLAGHASIKTTQVYVHLNEKNLEECYKNYLKYDI